MKYALGINIGGTNIKALALTPNGKALVEINTPTGACGARTGVKML